MGRNPHNFLDIGGGREWGSRRPDPEEFDTLRAVRLAIENPQDEYLIFDLSIPTEIAAQIVRQVANLHFVVGRIARGQRLPFGDASMSRVEMNHMYTPLAWVPFGPHNVEDYLYALQEAARVLRPSGVLAITEKRERLDRIIDLLSDSFGDLDDGLLNELGLESRWSDFERVTDPTRSHFTGKALEEQTRYEEEGDRYKSEAYMVYTHNFRKIR